MKNDPDKKTFLLVHGAWHGGWCYGRVARLLRARGHDVHVPTLTGVGERAHLAGSDVGLGTQVQDVVNLIRWEQLTGIVLVGHSYGGMVISGVAESVPHGTIASIVYLDAFLPEDGRCLYDYAPPEPAQLLEQTRSGLVAPFTAEAFNVNPRDRAWVDAQCTPHPLNCFTERLALTGARERIPKKAYVLATGWNGVFAPFAESLRQDPSWRVSEMAHGHDLMVDAPEELAALLETLA
jgi:pimeloyl-ACP methyl ester carboxylesterase